jgi:transcriptional regulator with XRE-family HTH domain
LKWSGFVQAEKLDRVEIGLRIKRLRQAQDITAQELARRASVSAGYLSEVERGLSAISVDKLGQIAEGLGVGVKALLGEKSPGGPDKDVIQIPAALSTAADQLNLSHRATLTLLQGQRSLMARRSKSDQGEWGVDDWIKFHEQVKDYLPEC